MRPPWSSVRAAHVRGRLLNTWLDTALTVPLPLAITPLNANGDGRPDLLVTYQNNAPALFLARGDGTFEKQAAGRGTRQEGASASFASASAFPLGAVADPPVADGFGRVTIAFGRAVDVDEHPPHAMRRCGDAWIVTDAS